MLLSPSVSHFEGHSLPVFLSFTITMDAHPTRILLYVCVTDIAGCPQRRYVTLAEAFCANVLEREYHYDLDPAGYDHAHIPAGFDSLKPLKRWFILD